MPCHYLHFNRRWNATQAKIVSCRCFFGRAPCFVFVAILINWPVHCISLFGCCIQMSHNARFRGLRHPIANCCCRWTRTTLLVQSSVVFISLQCSMLHHHQQPTTNQLIYSFLLLPAAKIIACIVSIPLILAFYDANGQIIVWVATIVYLHSLF